jgi:hypothetical protein
MQGIQRGILDPRHGCLAAGIAGEPFDATTALG